MKRAPRSERFARDHSSRAISGTGSGSIDLDFGDYEPPTSSESREQSLAFVWDPFLSMAPTLDSAERHSMIREWRASRDPRDFLFWIDGWGGTHRAFLHALRLLDVFRDFIVDDNAQCPGARRAFAARYDALNYRLHVDDIADCGASTAAIQYWRDTAFPKGVVATGTKGAFDSVNKSVHVCTEWAEAEGHVADALLAFAHRAYWYAMDGEAASARESLYYLLQAGLLGRLALGAVSALSRTLLHEMMHREFSASHCAEGCCMQRIALTFQCRVFSFMGLYAAGEGSTDDEFLGFPVNYRSECKARGSEEFEGSCEMNSPGAQGDPEDWNSGDGWSNPVGCP